MASRFLLAVRLACATLSWTGTATIAPGSVASGKLVGQPAVLDEPANELQASEISRRLIHWMCDVHLPKMIQAANFQVRETALAQGLKPLLVIQLVHTFPPGSRTTCEDVFVREAYRCVLTNWSLEKRDVSRIHHDESLAGEKDSLHG